MSLGVLNNRKETLQSFERTDASLSRLENRLEIPDKTIGFLHDRAVAPLIAEQYRGNEFLQAMEQSMALLLQERRRGATDVLQGPIFPLGLNGAVASVSLLRGGQGEWRNIVNPTHGSVPAHKIIDGTPLITVLRNDDAAREMTHAPHGGRAALWREAFRQAASRVSQGESLAMVRGGGWGHQPAAFLGGAELATYTKRSDGKPYELVFLPGYIGSMDSHSLGLFQDENAHLLQRLRLGMFPNQVEQSLDDIATLMDPSASTPEEKAKLIQLIALHSMGGHIALALSRYHTELPIIEAFKAGYRRDGNIIFADKPVMAGARLSPGLLPPWMRVIVESDIYRTQIKTQVPLQHGLKGFIVRAGADAVWDKIGLGGVREELLRQGRVPGVAELFGGFLDPDNIFDGDNIDRAHAHSYAVYREFHNLCVRLLDSADPIIGDNTIFDMRGNAPWLRVLYGKSSGKGRKDQVLNHHILEALVENLGLTERQARGDEDVSHHMSLDEIYWMLGVKV